MAKLPKRTDGLTDIDITALLNNPRAAGVRVLVDLITSTVTLTTKDYVVAVVALNVCNRELLEKVAHRAFVPKDVIVVRWGAEALH